MNRKILALVAAPLLLVPSLAYPVAQEEEELDPPESWQVRTDQGGHGAAGDLYFVEMPPGWHITTGPSGILYDPSNTASGSYRIEMEVFLFDPGRRREGFGLIFGGAGLEGDGQAYSYFLIRRDGSFLIKTRDGDGTSTVHGWTPHDAILTWEEREQGGATANNLIAVEVGGEAVTFFVNGEEVVSVPASDLHTDGIFGIRANHGLNLHVSKLERSG